MSHRRPLKWSKKSSKWDVGPKPMLLSVVSVEFKSSFQFDVFFYLPQIIGLLECDKQTALGVSPLQPYRLVDKRKTCMAKLVLRIHPCHFSLPLFPVFFFVVVVIVVVFFFFFLPPAYMTASMMEEIQATSLYDASKIF